YYTVQIARLKYYLSMRLDIFGAALFALSALIVLPLTQSITALLVCYLAIEIGKMIAAMLMYRQSVGVPILSGLNFNRRAMRSIVIILAPFALVNIFTTLYMRIDI